MIRNIFFKCNSNKTLIHLFAVIGLTISFFFLNFDMVKAQTPLDFGITSSYNPVGSGARALGMGGAFIAIADDATAASWNPGGLIQLEKPEVSIVGAFSSREEDTAFGNNPEASGTESVSFSELNYLSFAYPFSLFNRNMIVSVTYQNLFDFNRELDFLFKDDTGENRLDRNVSIDADGNLSAIGFSYCIGLSPNFSFGFTLNFWEDWLGNHGWDELTKESTNGQVVPALPFLPTRDVTIEFEERKENSFSGLNFNLGFLWQINSNLIMGGVLKTPFTADLDTATSTNGFFTIDDFRGSLDSPVESSSESIDMPLAYGIGFSYRFSDAFTAALDVYRTEWDEFLVTSPSGDLSPITGLSKEESNIDPTTQVRLGLEYLLIKPQYVVPIRGGIFYDPAPAQGSPDDIYGLTLGSGIGWKKIIFDIAYQYRWGNNIGSHLLRDFDFSYDLSEHSIYSSLILHF